MPETEQTDQQKMSAGLRELAGFLDENPEFSHKISVLCLRPVYDSDEFLDLIDGLGTYSHEIDSSHLNIIKQFGPVKFKIYCDKRLIGGFITTKKTIEVEEWKYPDNLLSPNEDKL